MSKAYHHVKNFDWPTMANLLKYSVKDPVVLTQKQKVTRLYRNCLRTIFNIEMHAQMGNMKKFMHRATVCRMDFEQMLDLQKEDPKLTHMVAYWEKYLDDRYDADEIIHESRPFAAASMRYYIMDNEKLTYDPIGYYSPRKVSGTKSDQYQQYLADYPMVDSHWNNDPSA